MSLPPAKVEQFHEIWRSLLNFVNEQLQVVLTLSGQRPEGNIDVTRQSKSGMRSGKMKRCLISSLQRILLIFASYRSVGLG